MTAVIRGELIKAVTTRTLFGYAGLGVALVIANVLIVTQFSSELDHVSDKQEAIAGLPVLLLLLGLVGAAGEYRHRTAAPAALAAGRDRGQLLLARAGAYAVTGVGLATLMAAVSLASGCPCWRVSPARASVPATSPPWRAGAWSPRRCRRSWGSLSARSFATRLRL